jgi:hypothetical protein
MVSKTENGQTTTYVYNYEDKMVQVNLPNGSSVVYSYDHSGKRIAKTAGGTTIDYYFDGDGTELEFVIMVIAVSCVKLLSAHNSTQHTSRKHKV